MSKVKSLLVMITSKCNLSCSFCVADSAMNCNDLNPSDTIGAIMEYLDTHSDIEDIIWSGGETLSVPTKLKMAVEIVKQHHPKINHSLITNGYYLTTELAQWVKTTFNSVTVSIDGFQKSERPFTKLIDKTNRQIIPALLMLDDYEVSTVVTKEQLRDNSWYRDIKTLYTNIAFLNPARLIIRLDSEMESPLTTDELISFTYGYLKIRDKVRGEAYKADILSIATLFELEESCNSCSVLNRILPDGTVEIVNDTVNIPESKGCSKMASTIGLENYKYLVKTLGKK